MGASVLVGNVLKKYLPEILKKSLGDERVIVNWKERCDKSLDKNDNTLAEIIYVGGGNAYVAFTDLETYTKATKDFLLEVYDKTVSIGIASAYVETDFESGYEEQNKELLKRLSEAKGKINRPIPAGNQPITRASLLTGLPVVEQENGEAISAEQVCKREARNSSKSSENKFKEFDDLIRGNNNYLAVIHVDGNSCGKLIRGYSKANNWDEVVPKIREMSKRISELYKKAYCQTVNKLREFYKTSSYYNKNSELPHIKIILDGDDITCVTAGQYGTSFAAELLRAIEYFSQDKNLYPFEYKESSKLTACAGVTIFHSHYPFSAAYKMAEECCSNAKSYMRRDGESMKSFIDFHLHQSGAVTSLKSYRKEQYETANGYLLNRPYCMSNESEYPLYSEFEGLMKEWVKIQNKEDEGNKPWPRSRLKVLYAAMVDDSKVAEVLAWCKSRGYILPVEIKDNEIDKKQYATFFDVLELADTYENISEGVI